MNLWKHLRLIAAAAAMLTVGSSAYADKPLLVQSCTRSTLCGATVVQFEEASDYPRRPLLLEPEGANVASVGSGSQKLGSSAVQFSGSNFLWAPRGGIFGPYFTVGVWIYPTVLGSTNQIQYLLSEDGDNIPGNAIYLKNVAGVLKAGVWLRDGLDAKNGSVIAVETGNLSLNAWHLLVMRARPRYALSTATGGLADGELSVIIDNGTPATAAINKPVTSDGGRLFVGKNNVKGSENYYTGYMDQLVISGARWTDQEAAFYWNSGAGLLYPFITGAAGYTTPTSEWRCDRNYAGNDQSQWQLGDDASGGADTTINTAGYVQWSTQVNPVNGGKAFQFLGTNPASYMQLDNTNENLKPYTGPWTFEGWVRFDDVIHDYAIVSDNASGTHAEIGLQGSSSKLMLSWNDGSSHTLLDSSALSANTWYFFVVRFDGSTYKISHNGTSGGSVAGNAATTFGWKYLGAEGGSTKNIKGHISFLGWYKGVALSDTEVGNLYNSGSGRECCPVK